MRMPPLATTLALVAAPLAVESGQDHRSRNPD